MSWTRIKKFVFRNWKTLVFFGIITLILLANSVHNSYPDEFDNILGGHLILKGMLPYRDFFSHHGPLAYFFAAIIDLFAQQSFVRFRVLMVGFFVGMFFLTYYILKRRTEKDDYQVVYIYIPLIALASTYFWGHMFLADPLSGYLLIPAYGLLFLRMFRGQLLQRADLVIISVFSALTCLMSTTYLYASLVLSAFTFLYHFSVVKVRFNKQLLRKLLSFGLIFAAPYLVFALYLLITGSISDYLFQAITYNKNYYIYNYPRPEGSTAFNPARYAIIILNNFLNNYQVLLSTITKTDFMNPYNLTLALTNMVLWLYLLWKRKFLLFGLSFFAIVYATVRSNPLNSQVTDYQSAVYFMLTFFNASFLFYILQKEKEWFARLAFIILLIYWIFNTLFFSMDLWRMSYNRFMGQMPLIYDRPQAAPIINAVVPKNNYCWIGPFQFEEIYYLNCKAPSKYQWILPQFIKSDRLMTGVISDYSKNKADIIVYQRGYSAFGASSDYNNFFIDFLEANYTRLKNIDPNLHFKGSPTKDFDLDEDFNFEKSKATQLVEELKAKGFLETRN